jgi:thymidylate kinase
MKMIIHAGGIDCSGKSTICTKLSELLDCKVVHFDKPKDLEDGKKQYFGFLNNKYITKNIICDRFHDGEHIYAPLYRGYESNYLKEFEQKLWNFPYLFINTTASLETILNRVKVRGEDFVKEEHFEQILNSYDKYLEKQSMPYIKVNTDNNDLDKQIKEILVAIDIVQKLYDYSVNNNSKNIYYGNIYAKYFVISNDRNIKDKLIDRGIYNQCWITIPEDKKFIEYQLSLLKLYNNNIEVLEDI